jgi:tripeptide aminopeptidase
MRGSMRTLIRSILSPPARFLGVRRGTGSATAPHSETGPYVSRIVSDAILLNEIPSPTEGEQARAQHVLQRLLEFGYQDASCDQAGTVTAVVPSREPAASAEHVLLFADIRCEEYSPLESMTRLADGRLYGRGVAESAIGAAGLLVLAEYLARNAIQYRRPVICLFAPFDLGTGGTQPLERFLKDWKDRVRFAAHVSGLELGRAEERPLGTCRLSVTVRTEEQDLHGPGQAASAIDVISAIAARLGSVRWDSGGDTFLNISRVEAGVGFGWRAAEGLLELEVFSPAAETLTVARTAVEATIRSSAEQAGAAVDITVKAFLPTGDPYINAGLVAMVRKAQERLFITSQPARVPGYGAFLNAYGIPAVTLGMTTGRRTRTEEYVDIRPLELGLRQLLGFLDDCAGWPGEEKR